MLQTSCLHFSTLCICVLILSDPAPTKTAPAQIPTEDWSADASEPPTHTGTFDAAAAADLQAWVIDANSWLCDNDLPMMAWVTDDTMQRVAVTVTNPAAPPGASAAGGEA